MAKQLGTKCGQRHGLSWILQYQGTRSNQSQSTIGIISFRCMYTQYAQHILYIWYWYTCRSCQPLLSSLGLDVEFPCSDKACVLLRKVPACFLERESTQSRRGRLSVVKSLVEVWHCILIWERCVEIIVSYRGPSSISRFFHITTIIEHTTVEKLAELLCIVYK